MTNIPLRGSKGTASPGVGRVYVSTHFPQLAGMLRMWSLSQLVAYVMDIPLGEAPRLQRLQEWGEMHRKTPTPLLFWDWEYFGSQSFYQGIASQIWFQDRDLYASLLTTRRGYCVRTVMVTVATAGKQRDGNWELSEQEGVQELTPSKWTLLNSLSSPFFWGQERWAIFTTIDNLPDSLPRVLHHCA